MMNPDEADEKDRNHRSADRRFERLPQGAEQTNGQKNLRAALDVARRIHRANPSISPAIYPDHRLEVSRLGFTRRYEDNYVNTTLNLFVDDLHDKNVLIDATGELLIFDPVIYLADTSE